MEQSPEIPMSFHVRMVTMIALLVSLDIFMVLNAADHVAVKGPNMMIMFGFEVQCGNCLLLAYARRQCGISNPQQYLY